MQAFNKIAICPKTDTFTKPDNHKRTIKINLHLKLFLCIFVTMILIADDDMTVLMSLRLMLTRKGYDVVTASSREEVIAIVRDRRPQLILMDMNYSLSTSGDEGLILLKQVKLFRPDTPVILMTAWGSIPLAVKGIQGGAFDFVTKPWDNEMLMSRISTALELNSEPDNPTEKDNPFDRGGIIGSSPGLARVLDTVSRAAVTDAPILIMGENGTGKEMVAEAVHRNSRRKDGPFVKVNLGGVPASLFESEMFGHRKGAFTGATTDRTGRFEMADNGTIFLDEIGDLDISCQVKLLRILQEGTFEPLGDSRTRRVNVRVVCATNADLPAMVADGRFREDLYYRINLITVTLPPLRERREDIPALARHFADMESHTNTKAEITPDGMRYLASLPYPGNIRELRNLVERTLIVGSEGAYTAKHFAAQYHAPVTQTTETNDDNSNLAGMTLEEVERKAIEEALHRHEGNLSKVALSLGITRQSLYRRMEKYGLN